MISFHTFGDSHACHPWNFVSIDNVIIYTNGIGQITCASFGI
jgi:hypothetical protein